MHNKHATIEELLEMIFLIQSNTWLYSKLFLLLLLLLWRWWWWWLKASESQGWLMTACEA
jgi:hypothetical protein